MINNAVFLAALNKALVDALLAPVKSKFPDIDTWWAVYVALATGFAIGWLAQVNIFGDYISHEMTSRILSALSVGLGSNLLHQVFNASVDLLRSRNR